VRHLHLFALADGPVTKPSSTMGTDPWVDRGTCPLLFEMGGHLVFPLLLGVDILITMFRIHALLHRKMSV